MGSFDTNRLITKSHIWFFAVFAAVVAAGAWYGVAHIPAATYQHVRLPMARVATPAGIFRDVDWINDGALVTGFDPDARSVSDPHSIWWLQRDGSAMKIIDLPPDPSPDCRSTNFLSPTSMRDGGIAFVRWCYGHPDSIRLMRYDPLTDGVVPLFPYKVPAAYGSFSFAAGRPPLFGQGSGIIDQIYTLEPEGPSQLNLGMVTAEGPRWSPDGQRFVFSGKEHIKGKPGPDWSVVPRDVWIMPGDCVADPERCADVKPQRLFPSAKSLYGAKWSPHNTWIATSGDMGKGREGVWLYNESSGALFLVDNTGDFGVGAWSPDGQTLALIGPPDTPVLAERGRNGLYLLNVSSVIGAKH